MKECIILGSGNAFNTNGRGHTSFLLDQKILIDCGPTILLKAEEYKIDLSEIEIILITHFHGDHYGGVPFLMIYYQYIINRNRPIRIVGPNYISKAFENLMNVMYPNIKLNFPVECISIQNQLNFYSYCIDSFPITHKEESIGYRIKDRHHSFAFTGDTILNQEVFNLLHNVDIGIIELSLWKRTEPDTFHVSLEELIQNRHHITAKQLYFNHISDDLAKAVEKIRKKNPNFGIPLQDGMKIQF